MRIGFVLVSSVLLLPSGAYAFEAHADAAAFAVAARHHVGERFTLDHCHLVQATDDEITCIGLLPEDAAGNVRLAGKLLIRVAAAETRGRTRALALCAGGALDEACEVSVAGEVFDASPSFGLGEAHLMGLREATICWPD
ncbi:hypothetical protein E4V01_15715 [Methylorubrum sp. Q1]|uniref:hypothetical protein n=1 Tax=Methylorubrum sp. Q1 TaxID=2562453 RepID=UPI001076A865|nr:hypothetical protein [Methylorubrum sp. Q1]TFZ57379.1 hypothetical protein E4V01_15715 [Methylorubrum sp. Q1]